MQFRNSKGFTRMAAILSFVLFLVFSLTACSKGDKKAAENGGLEKTELRYQGWAGEVILPELAEDLGYFGPIKLKWVGNTISGPQDIQAAASGDVDFGSAFAGAIVKLVAAKAPIKWVVANGGLNNQAWNGYYVEENSPIKTPKDLIGKKIAVNTLGAHHEFMIKEYLNRSGLTKEEIKKVELIVIPPVNGEQALRQKQVDVTSLGGILKEKALERGGIRPLFTDYGLFGEFSTSGYILTDKFIKQNPETSKKFVEALGKAIEWTKSTPREEVIARLEKIVKERNRNEDGSNLKYWKSTGVAGKGGLISENEAKIWIDWLVRESELKEGQLKPSDVYTNNLNPFLEKTKN